MKLSRLEQETIITFNGRMQRTLAELATDRPGEVQHIGTNAEGGETYTVPKGRIRVKPPRVASEAQREALELARQKSILGRKNTARTAAQDTHQGLGV